MRPLTIHEGAWFWQQVGPLLDARQARQLGKQRDQLEAEGRSAADAAALVATNVVAMSEDQVPPFDGESQLARMVRVARAKLANGTWRPEPEPVDPLAQSSEIFQNITGSAAVAAAMVPDVLPGPPLAITDTRERS